MKKYFFIFVLLIFVFVGCVPENEVLHENIATPTIIKIIPSSTPTLIMPTPTIFLSPLPTLTEIESIKKIYGLGFECDKPCWWGIIPGVSTWTETKQFIEQFYGYMGDIIDRTDKQGIKDESYSVYRWYLNNPIPGTDYAPFIGFEVQNNIVSAIHIPHEFVWQFFPVHKLFEKYGKPDKILMDIEDLFRIYVLYEDKHIMTRYSFSITDTRKPLNICLSDNYPEGPMFLWAPNTKWNLTIDSWKPLEQFSELRVGDFYEKFIDKSNQCFELSKNLLK